MNIRNACLGVMGYIRDSRNWRVVEKYDFRLPEIKRLTGLGWTDAEIGAKLGITRQRVGQIRDKACLRAERDQAEMIEDGHNGLVYVAGLGLCLINGGGRTPLEATAE